MSKFLVTNATFVKKVHYSKFPRVPHHQVIIILAASTFLFIVAVQAGYIAHPLLTVKMESKVLKILNKYWEDDHSKSMNLNDKYSAIFYRELLNELTTKELMKWYMQDW